MKVIDECACLLALPCLYFMIYDTVDPSCTWKRRFDCSAKEIMHMSFHALGLFIGFIRFPFIDFTALIQRIKGQAESPDDDMIRHDQCRMRIFDIISALLIYTTSILGVCSLTYQVELDSSTFYEDLLIWGKMYEGSLGEMLACGTVFLLFAYFFLAMGAVYRVCESFRPYCERREANEEDAFYLHEHDDSDDDSDADSDADSDDDDDIIKKEVAGSEEEECSQGPVDDEDDRGPVDRSDRELIDRFTEAILRRRIRIVSV